MTLREILEIFDTQNMGRYTNKHKGGYIKDTCEILVLMEGHGKILDATVKNVEFGVACMTIITETPEKGVASGVKSVDMDEEM